MVFIPRRDAIPEEYGGRKIFGGEYLG